MMNNDEIQLKSTKKEATQLLAFIIAILYIVELVNLVTLVYQITRNKYDIATYLGILFLAILVILFICSKSFSWNRGGKIYKKNNKIYYEVFEIVQGIGSGKTTYKIKSIDSIDKHKRYLTVKGDITEQESLSRPRHKYDVRIEDYNDEVITLLEEFAKKGK